MADKIKTVKAFDAKAPTKLVVEWADGKKATYDSAKFDKEIVAQLIHHGLKQKLMDAHAGGFKEYGNVAGCRGATEEVYESLASGTFNAGRESDGGWIVTCLAELTGTERDVVRAKFDKMPKGEQAKVRRAPEVLEWKLAHDKKRAGGETIDVGSLFAGE